MVLKKVASISLSVCQHNSYFLDICSSQGVSTVFYQHYRMSETEVSGCVDRSLTNSVPGLFEQLKKVAEHYKKVGYDEEQSEKILRTLAEVRSSFGSAERWADKRQIDSVVCFYNLQNLPTKFITFVSSTNFCTESNVFCIFVAGGCKIWLFRFEDDGYGILF